MLKTILLLAFMLVAVNCGGCPHARNKRQLPNQRPQPNGRQPIGQTNNRQPIGQTNNRQPTGQTNNLQPPPPGNNQNPNMNNNNKDRRTRPTEVPTTRAPPVPPSSCDRNKKYRSFDGSCNNLINSNLGKAETSFKRYLEADYDDDNYTPRKLAANGGQLPNPRVISRSLMDENSESESEYNAFLVYYGQFLAHDLTEIQDTTVNGEFVDCPCGSTNNLCLPFEVPANDDKMTQSCITFTRSTAGFSTHGTNKMEQVNFLSSFIDATQVYGSDETISNELRTFVKGQMKVSDGNLLPLSETDFSCSPNFDLQCFIAGEPRPSENLALTAVHTLHLREHNRIANQLSVLNPSWNDETLYNEARRILTAIIQHIVYKEWLPEVIGTKDRLKPLSSGFFNGYDASVNPSIANEFAVSAFRFGHTLISNSVDRLNFQNNIIGNVDLSSIIFDSTEAYNNGGLESIFTGILAQAASKFDINIVDTLQNHLFEFGGIALDLPAININRARDHGVPGYSKFRELCSGNRLTNFDQLRNVMSTANINKLRSVYSSVADIDLFVGGLLETPQNGLVGPTVACIIEKQFYDLKVGDRFYYENGPSPISFTSDQLSEIRKASISGLICENFNANVIQPKAFKTPLASTGNQRVGCNRIPKVDLSKWKI